MVTFGWEKALGDAGELAWWEARVAEAAAAPGHPDPEEAAAISRAVKADAVTVPAAVE